MITSELEQPSGVPPELELLERAGSLAGRLGARATEGESLRRLPDANVQEVQAAGVYRSLQARKYGGLQVDLHTFIDATAAVARGCGSTAWCVGVTNAHHWLAAAFPMRAQDEVYADDADALISAVITPRGRAERTQGGYKLTGVWPFCSGSHHADWLMLGAQVVQEDGTVTDEGEFLLPAANATVKDDWNVGGLRATGSNTVVTKDAFVPAHRFLSLRNALDAEARPSSLHPGQLYLCAAMPVLALALAPPALGIAESALDDFKLRLPGREVAYTSHEKQLDMPTTHLQVAQAEMKVRCARLLLHGSASDIESFAAAGAPMPLPLRARVRMDVAYAVRLCLEAVEILYLATGGSGISDSNPIQRAQRDLHAINMHGLTNLETNLELYGRVVLGLPPKTPLV